MSNRQTVAFCTMTYNDEKSIGAVLKSVLALVDEVIVVDIGSDDATRLIAEGYGARVIDFSFNGDYADAKNAALDAVRCDWVLWLNPNEVLAPTRPYEFQRLLHSNAAAYSFRLNPAKKNIPLAHIERVRLWRVDSKIRFEYPVREKIEFAIKRWMLDTNYNDIVMTDQVYIDVVAPPDNLLCPGAKHVTSILRHAANRYPNDPYIEYVLACEIITIEEDEVLPNNGFYMALHFLENSWRKVHSLAPYDRSAFDFIPDLLHKLMSCYLVDGQVQIAWNMVREAKQHFPYNDRINLLYIAAGISYLYNVIKDPRSPTADSIADMLQNVIEELSKTKIRKDYLIRYAGELALFRGRIEEAISCFEKTIDFNPDYSFAWLGLARCHLYNRNATEAVKCCMEATRVSPNNHLAWLIGSQILDRIGFKDNAKTWRSVLKNKFPHFQTDEIYE